MTRVLEPIIGKQLWGFYDTNKINLEKKENCIVSYKYENIDGNRNVVPKSVCSIEECLKQIQQLRNKPKVYD